MQKKTFLVLLTYYFDIQKTLTIIFFIHETTLF